MPIREQNSSTILTGNNVTDSSSLLLFDLQNPSKLNLFDESSPNYFSSSILTMNLSDRTTTVNKSTNYSLTDNDLAALFVSSFITTTPSPSSLTQTTTTSNNSIDNNNETPNNTIDDVLLNQVTDLVCCTSPSIMDKQSIGPPPGFENFIFNSSSTSDLLSTQTTNNNKKNNSTLSSINNDIIQTPVSSSDTINFSQLLQSTAVDPQQQQQSIVGNVRNIRSSSSSHSSFTSDDQSIFFPISTHPYSSSSYATSQIFSTNTPSSSTTTTNSAANPHIPNSLSLNNNNNNFSSSSVSLVPTNSTTDSPPISSTTMENDKRITDGGITSSHIFSFFSNGHPDFPSSKYPTNKHSSTVARKSSSSASSSTSSSIDDALIHLTQQQQQVQNVNKFFNDEPTSIFHFPKTNIDKQQQAVHDNISFLASMATASTSTDSDINLQHQIHANMFSLPQVLSRNIQELMQNLNELCYKGFDELNALIQEQRWVQSYVSINSSLILSPNSPSGNLNGSNSCSSRILIVSEYFIFKCKKVEITASHVFQLLANGRAELRLRDLMFVFKSWKDSILNAEKIHQEEENKLRLSIEHPQSYYMTNNVLQAAFDRVSYAIRQLCNITQQARAAFQYATLNVFQTTSRQQQQQSQLSSTSITLAQLQAMQQQKSSSIPRINGSIDTIL